MKWKFVIAHMRSAYVYAGLSYAKRLKVGAVYVKNNKPLSVGYNGTPTGECNICEDENGNTKPSVIHAEINGLRGFQQLNESARDSILFLTHSPCSSCAGELIANNIKAIIFHNLYRDESGIEKILSTGRIPVYQLKVKESILDNLNSIPEGHLSEWLPGGERTTHDNLPTCISNS